MEAQDEKKIMGLTQEQWRDILEKLPEMLKEWKYIYKGPNGVTSFFKEDPGNIPGIMKIEDYLRMEAEAHDMSKLADFVLGNPD